MIIENAKDLDVWLRSKMRSKGDRIAIAYDNLPRTALLHGALMDGLKVEFDYDRVGTSKTGYIYRLMR